MPGTERAGTMMTKKLTFHLTAPVIGSGLILLVFGAVVTWYLHHLQRDNAEILELDIVSVKSSEELELLIGQIQAKTTRFLLTGDRGALAGVPALRAEADERLATAERVGTKPEEQEMTAKIRAGYTRFFQEYDRLTGVPEIIPGMDDDRWRDMANIVRQEIRDPADEYVTFNMERMDQLTRHNAELSDRVTMLLVLIGLGGALAGTVTGYLVARGLRRTMVQLRVPIRSAAGKLNEVIGPLTLEVDQLELDNVSGVIESLADHVTQVVERLHESQREVVRGKQLAAIGQLAAGMAHEVRNPLMAMKILVQTASEAGADGALTGRDLLVIGEEIDRVERSVQSLLDFARPPRLERRRFDVRGLVSDVTELVGGRAELQGVRLVTDCPAKPVVIDGDREQIRQVVLNLVLNALDATGRGGNVTIRIEDADGAGPESVRLVVADDGSGLPADLADKVFDPFVSTKETGSGLGLSICRRITEAHGGSIAASANPGRGASFTVTLPHPGAERLHA